MTDALGRRVTDAGRWLFGDRQGVVLWLALVFWFGLTWRVGFFIQDTYATANTLVALADGQLHVTELRYSITFGGQPGLYEYNGRLYGRNYGQLVVAVPLVWALEGLAAVVDPRLLLAGLWAGVGLAGVAQLSHTARFDRQRTRAIGSSLVAVLFIASVLTATDLPREQLALVAFQLSTILAAATAGLVLYRLVSVFHSRRLGLAAGTALGLGTPVGFWATLPKRHTLVAMLTLGAVYAFAVSRRRDGRAALRARAGAYAFAGAITWVHAFEGLFVVVVVGAVDLLTARSTGVRDIVVVALVLSLALTPMFATNYAITGNPAEPPRLLPDAGDDVEFVPESVEPETDTDGSDGSGVAVDDDNDSSGGSSVVVDETGDTEGDDSVTVDSNSDGGQSSPSVADIISDATGTISKFAVQSTVDGVETLGEPERLVETFVRSGTISRAKYEVNKYETIELALLEVMPVLGALSALPVLLGRALSRARDYSFRKFNPRTATPARQTDLLVVALTVVLTVVYLPRLPLHSMLTVRYLHPIIPLAAYGVCRIPAVRAGVTETAWLWRSYLASLAVALVVMLGGSSGLGLALGEAVQYTALWNLGAATACAGVVVGRTLSPDRVSGKAVAVGIAAPVGFTTAYLLLSGLVYFNYGSYALDLVGLLADILPTL